MSTILKWAGNKTAVMYELKKHLPAGPRLVEPFAGSCAVMMATEYPHYLVADINPDLINLYQMIKSDVELFIYLAKKAYREGAGETNYYEFRKFFNTCQMDSMDKAVFFLYLNRHGYRGLCRYNKKGEFNNPYGNYKKPYFPEVEIRAFAEKAERATFVCAGYQDVLFSMLRLGDVIYCDPPYDETFSDYHTAGFTAADHVVLATNLERRARSGHPVIVSNSDTSLTRNLYRNFASSRITAKRSIGVAAGKGKSAEEIIAVFQPWARFIGFDLAGGPDTNVVCEVRA
ncbi:DNA adenine methylase [Klebsiella pasteurii]|uniref:DNA adenine methylase n=1 Tax=Klebsiella TaxID=570 RepID=UPI0011582887|nr:MULTISPECIES: DNA adenine methylase [Klebsiella]MEB6371405.1 DNA adenine methylase [Klebsiella michiganensis]VUT14870.1 DNA adenine methylase [Klebsiella pasteurii]